MQTLEQLANVRLDWTTNYLLQVNDHFNGVFNSVFLFLIVHFTCELLVYFFLETSEQFGSNFLQSMVNTSAEYNINW
jgi:hypothetical protein